MIASDFRVWQKHMESVRKDIECVLGRLKGRFRILKCPIQLQKKHEIDNMFITRCVLYNMLHHFDGLGKQEHDINYNGVDGLFMDDTETENTSYWDPLSRIT